LLNEDNGIIYMTMQMLLFLIFRRSAFFDENDVFLIPEIHINVHRSDTIMLVQRHKRGFANIYKGFCDRWLRIWNQNYKMQHGGLKMADKNWKRDQFLYNLVFGFQDRWLWIWSQNYKIQNGEQKWKTRPIFIKFGM